MTRSVALYVKDVIQNMLDAEEFIQADSIRSRYSDIPWKEMAGMRDKLIHFYFGVDQEAVWVTVKERIPTIRPIFEKILQDLEK